MFKIDVSPRLRPGRYFVEGSSDLGPQHAVPAVSLFLFSLPLFHEDIRGLRGTWRELDFWRRVVLRRSGGS